MNLIRYRPSAPLDRYIECFWWSHRDRAQEHREYMLPSGTAQLLFALHETPILCDSMSWSGSVVHGPQSSYYVAGPKPIGAVLGVAFRPAAAAAVLGVSTAELVDRHVTLDAIWGSRAVDLRHQLRSTAAPAEGFRILEQFLSARVQQPRLLHPAVAQALAACAHGTVPAQVAQLQQAAGYSAKHFIALFRAAVGLTPKHFMRIRRFNNAVTSLAAGNAHGLGDIAASTGYADQAHLTREFREFAGLTPTQYRPGGHDRPLHAVCR